MDIKPYEPGEFCKTIGCPDFGKIEICSSCCLLYQFHSYFRDHNQILESGSNIEKMVQEAERLRKELADGDYWMQRAEEFSENGGCPLCFGTDEEGHKDGCEVMLLEIVNAGLIEASIKSDWDWQAIVDKLKFEISALKSQISNISPDRLQEICAAEAGGRLVVLPCKEILEKAGDVVYLIDDGEIVEVVHCGAQISPDGEIHILVAADDKIFPFREPDAEFDLEPSDWCTNGKFLNVYDFGKTVFLSRGQAEAALKEETL